MNIMNDPIGDAISNLPIEVKLLWPSGVIQEGATTKSKVTEYEHDGKRLVTLTFEVKPHDHLAAARAALTKEV